jgi:hypothetical protein
MSNAVNVIVGLVLVSITTSIITLAFFAPTPLKFVINIVGMNSVFIIAYLVWKRINKNYEKIYKSTLGDEETSE